MNTAQGQIGTEATQAALEVLCPVPGDAERAWLCDALQQVYARIDWIEALTDSDVSLASIGNLRSAAWARVPQAQRGARVTLLRGDFGHAGAIVGLGEAELPRGVLVLRGLFWVALWRWQQCGQLPCSAADTIASALRAASDSPISPAARALGPIADHLATARGLNEALDVLVGLRDSPHAGLRLAWRALDAALRSCLRSKSPSPLGVDKGPVQTPRPVRPRPTEQDPSEPDDGMPFVHPLRPRSARPDQLPGEPADEFNQPVDLVLVPGYGNGTLSRRLAAYQASQAIWSGNSLLLTTHPDVLPRDVFGEALRLLVESLEGDSLGDPETVGTLVCLLKALTGRTTPGIRAMQFFEGESVESPLVVDLANGFIEFPPAWKAEFLVDEQRPSEGVEPQPTGFFRASTQEHHAMLAPVCDRIALPLVRPIHRVLRRHHPVLTRLVEMEPLELDQQAAKSADLLSTRMGIGLTAAALRRSLGPQILENTGDLAIAQLICGDTFGRPLAQQHYYAPRRKDIAAAYMEAVGHHFPESGTTAIRQAAARIGSELLISVPAGQQLAHASIGECKTQSIGANPSGCFREQHQQQVDHLARMIFATAGHRPTEALFRLTIHDIDTRSGAALFCDKRIDTAHDPRLACLPKMVCQQIEIYLRHLNRMAASSPDLRQTIEAIHAGALPLLLDLDEFGALVPLSIAVLKRRSPPEWNALPWNWGRTHIRTRGIEMGASPFLVACQLGHFDAVGYPFSNQSPTTPIEVVKQTQPWLDRLARNQGWRIQSPGSGADVSQKVPHAPNNVPALRDWTPQITQSDRAASREHQAWERQLRRGTRKVRESALQRVLEQKDLVDAGVVAAFQNAASPRPVSLSDADLFRIRAELVDDAEDNAAMAVAVVRALRRVLSVVSSRTGQSFPSQSIPIAIRRPVDNAMIPGACLALRQMHALRDHVRDRAAVKRPSRAFAIQVARTAEALALFGFVESVNQLLAILRARSNARPSARIPDLMLVPLPDGQVVGLRGVTALALANLAQAHPESPLPDIAVLEAELSRLLPEWAIGHKSAVPGLLVRLCSTTAVVNRFELSPAARFAVDPEQGSTHADMAEQLAFIDGDSVGPTRGTSGDKDISNARIRPIQGLSVPKNPSGTPRSQYRALCRMIPRVGKELVLPLTGQRISASSIQTATTRTAMLQELDAFRVGPGLWPIVHMLADWLRKEMLRTTSSGKSLAYTTLETYLTRVGGALIEMLGEVELGRWDEQLLEDTYLYALGASDDAKMKVAAALLSFHEHCQVRWDLPEIDLGFVYAELSRGQQRADSAMILPIERAAALERIHLMAWQDQAPGFEATRIARVADVVSHSLAWGGARFNEPLGLQVRDVGQRPDGSLWVRLRANRARSLKTRSASRVLGFRKDPMESTHRMRVLQRVVDVRAQAGSRRPESAYLMADSSTSRNNIDRDPVAQLIRDALAVATGRSSERLHRLRHLVATEFLMDVVLSRDDAARMEIDCTRREDSVPLTPRDLLAVSTPLGHSHGRITIQCYLHMPWILQSRSAQNHRADYFDRRHVAGALGYTPATLDSVLRGSICDPLEAWFEHFRPGRAVESPPTTGIEAEITQEWEWNANRVARLVDLAGVSKSLESAMRTLGAPMRHNDAIVRIAEQWEIKLGLRLIPSIVNGAQRRCPARAMRWLHVDEPFRKLLAIADEERQAGVSVLEDIAAEFFRWLSPKRGPETLLPMTSANDLICVLVQAGLPRTQINLNEMPGGLTLFMVEHEANKGASPRFLDAGLRCMLVVIGIATELCREPV